MSSGQAELHGNAKTDAESIGMHYLVHDFGIMIANRTPIYASVSAALGVTQGSGIGRVKHLDTQIRWVQEKRIEEIVVCVKVRGTEKPADMMTKHVSQELIERYLRAPDEG